MFGSLAVICDVLSQCGHIFARYTQVVSESLHTRPMEVTQLHFYFHNLHRGQARSLEVTAFFANNILRKRDTAGRMLSLCSASQDASNGISFDLFRSN